MKNNKNKIYYLLICLVGAFHLSAQELTIPDPSQTVIPPSPTASALAVYGEIPVGTYTGIPSINVPITNLSGHRLGVPINLNYHSGSVKLDAMAGWTGLGWSLSAGGVITRSVIGLEDNDSQGYKNNPVISQLNNGILDFSNNAATIEQMAKSNWDGEVDIYHFNVLSYSGSFVIDQGGQVRLIPYQDLKIEQPSEGVFKMTVPDGTKFTFDVTEETESSTTTNGNNSQGSCESGSSPPSSMHISAWYLSKIEDANETDEINFTYAEPFDLQYETGISATKYFDGVGGGDCAIPPDDTECVSSVITTIRNLSSIESTYGKVDFITSSGRTDSGGRQLDTIQLFGADKTTLLKKWALQYDYFLSSGSICSEFPERCQRLKLESVQELPNDETTPLIPPYTFTYLDENNYRLNPRLSYGQDHWGFNNGVTNNLNLLPAYVFRYQDYSGANRDTDTAQVKAGLLHQIHYPSGGYRQIDFEANSIHTGNFTADLLTASSSFAPKTAEVKANLPTAPSDNPSVTFTIPHGVVITTPILIGENKINTTVEWNGHFTLVDANGKDYCISGGGNISCAPNNNSLGIPSLPAGTYTFTAHTLVNGDFSQMKIAWTEHVRTEQTHSGSVEIPVGGTRVRSIKTYDGNNELVNTQAYQYTQHDDATKSSGKLITLPRYAYQHREYRNTENCNTAFDCSFSAISSSPKAPLGSSQGSHVCYPEVTMLYGENGAGGRTEFTYSFKGDTGGTGFPYSQQTSYEWQRGLLLEQKDYAADDLSTPVHKITNTYNFRENDTLNNHSVTSLKIGYRVLGSTCPTTANFNCTSETVNQVYYGNCEGFLGGVYHTALPKANNTGIPILSLLTNNCEVIAYHPCYGKSVGTSIPNPNFENQFAYRTYEHISRWFFLEKTVEVTDGVSVITDYEYDETLGRHTKPTKITLTNSDGKKHQTRMTYVPEAAQASPSTSLLNLMNNRFMIGLPVKNEKYVQENGNNTWDFQGAISIDYAHFEPNGTSQYLPRRYNQILSNGIELERLQLYQYNEEGFLEQSQKRGFPVRDYTWENGLLTSVQYQDWLESFTYHPNSRLRQSHTAIDGQVVQYTYDGYQRLKTQTARSGAVVTTNNYDYSYATQGVPNTIESQTVFNDGTPNQTNKQILDGLGRPLKTSLNGVVKNEVIYDNLGRIDQQTYLPGNFTTLEYDNSPLNRVLREVYPNGTSSKMAYGSQGNYYKVSQINENSDTTTTLSDILGRPYQIINALGDATTYEYSDNRTNQPTKIIPPMGDDAKFTYHYTFDERVRPATKTLPQGGTMTYTYDDLKDLMSTSTDAKGNVLTYHYDIYGRDSIRLLGNQIISTVKYDEGGGINIGKMTQSKVWQLGTNTAFTTDYEFDTFGRMERSTAQNHVGGTDITDYTYNHADWQLTALQQHTGHENLSIGMGYEYDGFGRVTKTIQSLNGQAQLLSQNAWNNRDQLVRKILGNGLQKIDYEYNNRGWLTQINKPFDYDGAILDCSGGSSNSLTQPELLTLLDSDIHCGGAEESIDYVIANRFDSVSNFNINCYNPCENTGGIHTEPNCTPTEASQQITSLDIARDKMITAYTVNQFRQCDDGIEKLYHQPDASKLTLPNKLYRIRLCNGSQAYIFENELAFITGDYHIIQEQAINYTTQLFSVKDRQGISSQVALEELIHLVVEGKNIYVNNFQPNQNPCSPQDFDCSTVEQMQNASILAIIEADNNHLNATDLSYPTNLYRVKLCSIGEVYLFADELDQFPDNYSILQTIPLTNAGQKLVVGNTFSYFDGNDLFFLKLHYTETESKINADSQKNGNISYMDWQVNGQPKQSYGFQYDALNRLEAAKHSIDNYIVQDKASVHGISYDKNGNIESIIRHKGALTTNTCFNVIDNLTYTYSGNQLTSIIDNAPPAHRAIGFNPSTGGTYTYDANGNLSYDPHKQATFSYNYLNLPTTISVSGQGTLNYGYNANGVKLSKSNGTTTREYVNGIEYVDNQLEAIYHNEGRIVKKNGNFEWQWALKDHLGNTRILFSDINNDGDINASSELLSIKNYYPFGMEWDTSTMASPAMPYLYNGKELDTDFGLNWYHYGARMYDPAIARFTGVDPISDQFAHVSTYNYAENEPIGHIDLHGLQKAKPNPAKGVDYEWQPDEAEMIARSRYPTQNDVYADPSRINFSNPNEVTQFEADKNIVRRNRVWKWFEIAIEGVGALDLVPNIGSLFTFGKKAVSFGSSFSKTLFNGVNDIGGSFSCSPTAIACDIRMGGSELTKASDVVGGLGRTLDDFNYRGVGIEKIEAYFGTSAQSFNSIGDISSFLKGQGNGSRGLILGKSADGKKGHTWNAYIDGTGTFRQLDKANDVSWSNYYRSHDLQFIQTN